MPKRCSRSRLKNAAPALGSDQQKNRLRLRSRLKKWRLQAAPAPQHCWEARRHFRCFLMQRGGDDSRSRPFFWPEPEPKLGPRRGKTLRCCTEAIFRPEAAEPNSYLGLGIFRTRTKLPPLLYWIQWELYSIV